MCVDMGTERCWRPAQLMVQGLAPAPVPSRLLGTGLSHLPGCFPSGIAVASSHEQRHCVPCATAACPPEQEMQLAVNMWLLTCHHL